MEAMAPRGSSGNPPKTVLRQGCHGVAEVHQAVGHLYGQGKRARHWEGLALTGQDPSGQVHEAATFRVDHSSVIGELLHCGKHFAVRAELGGVELGIPAAEIEGVGTFGQRGIPQGAEFHDLRPGFAERIEVIFVVKAKGAIASNRHLYPPAWRRWRAEVGRASKRPSSLQ